MFSIENISLDELTTACPELQVVRTFSSPDDVLGQVRESRATVAYHSGRDNKKYHPDTPPHSTARAHKDYELERVKQLDAAKAAYWVHVKREIRILVCTSDTRYDDLRKRIKNIEPHGKQAIVAIVAATIGSSLGVAAGAISVLLAVALFAVVKIGVNAFCAMPAS